MIPEGFLVDDTVVLCPIGVWVHIRPNNGHNRNNQQQDASDQRSFVGAEPAPDIPQKVSFCGRVAPAPPRSVPPVQTSPVSDFWSSPSRSLLRSRNTDPGINHTVQHIDQENTDDQQGAVENGNPMITV